MVMCCASDKVNNQREVCCRHGLVDFRRKKTMFVHHMHSGMECGVVLCGRGGQRLARYVLVTVTFSVLRLRSTMTKQTKAATVKRPT